MAATAKTSERIILLTTAPREYDGFGTEELSSRVGQDNRGVEIRKVAILTEHYRWQTDRYSSGMHGHVRPADARLFGSIWRLDS